jgi:ketosteroid isomerase-like protein
VSEANVELIRRGYEAFNHGDADAVLEGFDPNIEWRVPDTFPDPDTYHGHDGVRKFWEMWRGAFDDFRVEIEELIDAGDMVVAMTRVHGRGKGSGAEVATPSFPHVWTVRDGKAVRMEMLQTREAALEAVGLSREREQ